MTLLADRGVHLVGLGGAGMSGIARILLQRGYRVSGSDLQPGRALAELAAMGARVTVGHDAAAIGDADVVVVSSAVRDDNPEVRAAREQGRTILRRAEMLAALMADDAGVAVSGAHGKTTTTSMTVVGLQASGADPSFAIGAALNETGTNAHAGTDPVFVAEVDESDRSFLVFEPDVAVVTNVELDHPDAFASHDEVAAAFAAFLERRRDGGTAVVCRDDPGAAAVAATARPPVVTFGSDPRADVRIIDDGDGAARLRRDGHDLVTVKLAVPGRHNLLNAAGALTVCHLLDADLQAAAAGLARFAGAARRFQMLGSCDGVTVVDDYAHNPTKLRAALAAARTHAPARLVVVVQPHRYSRTAVLGAELGRAAAGADVVVVTDVYASSEAPVPGVSGRLVADAAEAAGAKVVWQPHLGAVVDDLQGLVRPGDLVLVTGAGDVTQVGPALLQRLLGVTRA